MPDPGNVRKHGARSIAAIKASLSRFGQQTPITVTQKDKIIRKGNGTWTAARELGWTHILVQWSELSGADAVAYSIADNRSSELSEFDTAELARTLDALRDDNFEVADLGFTDAELKALTNPDSPEAAAALLQPAGAAETTSASPPTAAPDSSSDKVDRSNDGNLLALLDVTIAEPRNKVAAGDVYRLGPHVLVCADVMNGLASYLPFLSNEVMFAPFAGPFAPLTERAEQKPLVIVQPDPYIAGHILDQYENVNGKGSFTR
jgi:hypothetical protein